MTDTPKDSPAAQRPMIGTIVAIGLSMLMIPMGLIIAMSQVLQLKFLEPFIALTPGSDANFIGLFGMFVFGIGLAVLLTQVFTEHYTAQLSGLTFAGTLAALLVFMLIARYTVFDTPDAAAATAEESMRALRLEIQCPSGTTSAAQRQAFLMIEPGPGAADDILEAFTSSPAHLASIVDPASGELAGVRIPSGAIVVRPLFGGFGASLEFDLPKLIHSRLRSQLTVFAVTRTAGGASSNLTGAQDGGPIDRRIARIQFSQHFPDPKIEAWVDLTEAQEVCGA